MDEHRLAGVCAYIKDFMDSHLKDKPLTNITVFVEDRFSRCSESKKEKLRKIFNELNERILQQGKLNVDTYDTANDLLKVLW